MLPKVDPILPVLSRTVPIGREWLYEAKLDGFRGVLSIENGRGSFLSKTRRPMARFKELADLLARGIRVEDAIFDGEIVVMTDAGPDFYALFGARGEPAYAAFDLLWLNGVDLRMLPLHKRKRKLRAVTKKGPIAYIEALRDPTLFDAAVRLDIEGIVAKRRGDAYAADTEWVKVKHPGYTQGVGRAELFHWMRRR
jgi:bifunctional non-homologous end joining protein LigD